MFDIPIKLSDIEEEDDGSVWESIKAYEAILEKHPDDTLSLTGLAASYEKTGDTVRTRELYVRATEIFEHEGKWRELRETAERLIAINPTDEKALALREHAVHEILKQGDGGKQDKSGETGKGTPFELTFDLNAELELAWLLLQKELISQEQYEKAISGLTESRMNPMSEATLALLQELAGMERVKIPNILGFLSAHTNTAYIDVNRFEINLEVANRIPLAHARKLGALVFSAMGSQLQVAILNPIDDNLKKRIQNYLKEKVHFFLTSPEAFQEAIKKIEDAAKITRVPSN